MTKRESKYANVEERKKANSRMTGERRKRLVALGYCQGCTKEWPEKDRTMCQKCLDKLINSVLARNAKRLAEGLCTTCGKPAFFVEGHGLSRFCAKHLVIRRQYRRKVRENNQYRVGGPGGKPASGTEDEDKILNGYVPE